MGENPIPNVPVKLDVKDFGAKGDGTSEDSEAFLRAIEAIEDGAIFIPEGRYKLTQVLVIRKSNVVLRGAGPEKTVLFIPKNLDAVLGPQNDSYGNSGYAYGREGFIMARGDIADSKLADVVIAASRGDRALILSSTSEIKPGQMVLLEQREQGDGSYLKHLNGDQLDGGNFEGTLIRFASRVNEVQGNTIVLERPLRSDVRPEWRAQIREFGPTVSEVGIEDLTMEFAAVEYSGHLNGLGYNGIEFKYVTDSWVRNVHFINADNGVSFDHSHFSTLDTAYFGAYERRGTDNNNVGNVGIVTGHHGINVSRADDNLFTGFEFDTRFVHDITLHAGTSGNVFSNGKGVDVNFDHHRKAPIENLFTDIDLGEGSRPYASSGSQRYDSPHSGARETFWNLRSRTPLGWPEQQDSDDLPWGPDQLNFVGISTNGDAILSQAGKWFETINPNRLFPPDLHLAQLAKRLQSRGTGER